ncbi:hypothetical protein MAA8898_01455 [Maliponia aquimaris]|uniref:Uncharacterized protein n=1 Tax=Maliponia aquimaris TaxID=1673631 RepID=A0A238K5T3_9RHOB|nr:hypothetical protein MAA8898_01455 [Maliponia aquimaris]
MTKHSQPAPTAPKTPVPGTANKPATYRFTDWAAF